jgi:pimeloyl-ACP methyl ester carboxylesterase
MRGTGAAASPTAETPHLFLLFLLIAAACATPSQKAERRASALGFERQGVTGSHFEHILYWKPGSERSDAALHVYIEGDGSPRRAMRYRPPDPTPSNLVMLELMALDPGPSLYLGRPAQHGTPAEPWDWTVGRYSNDVADSMARALENWSRANGRREFVLIGHSGGGTLAMLLAERVENTLGVVTLAGNLDLEAWALHHDYQPLDGSEDPARRPPLDRDIFQLHLLAGRDQRVPIALVESSIARQPDPKTRRFPDFDHSCCWTTIWLDVVAELQGHEASR